VKLATDLERLRNMKTDSRIYEKARDLAESLSIDNVSWNAWELEFIESFADTVLDEKPIHFSVKQVEKIEELWENL
jgi:hypothetical protein